MPENTISSSATHAHVDMERTRNRQAMNTEQRVQQEGSSARSNDQGVEVTLSQQSRDLELNSNQVVAGAGQAERSARTGAESVDTLSRSESIDRTDSTSEPRASETGDSGSVTRQYNQSANDALGTVIDIRS